MHGGKWKQTRGTREVPAKDYISGFGWDEFCCFDVVVEGRRFINPNLVIKGKGIDYEGIDPETGRRAYGPDIINRYALDFIDRNKEKPFFLYYPMVLVHDEHTPTPDTRPKALYDDFDIENTHKYGHWKGDDRRFFPDMLAYMDKLVGKVLDKLDEHGLSDNTLVVVMGDNGTKESFAHILPDGTVYPGGKGGNKDNGLHVPLLLRLPGKIPVKSVYEGLLNLTDIYPTLSDAAGIKLPNTGNIDGISFWSQATRETKANHRDAIYTWYNGNRISTDLDLVIEYAFDAEFKRYSPDLDYPEGRFFDLRSDLLEEVGDVKVAVKKAWNKWHYSGLDLSALTLDQKIGYERLGQVLDAKSYVPVESLKIAQGSAMKVKVGDRSTLRCEALPRRATRRHVIWESSDPSIATVDKFGILTPRKKGKVTVSAYSWDDSYPVASNAEETFSKEGIKDCIEIEVSD